MTKKAIRRKEKRLEARIECLKRNMKTEGGQLVLSGSRLSSHDASAIVATRTFLVTGRNASS